MPTRFLSSLLGSGRAWRSGLALACFTALFAAPLTARADDEETADLKERVEDLERTNRKLIRALEKSRVFDDVEEDLSDEPDDAVSLFHSIAAEADAKKEGGSKEKEKAPADEWYEVGSDLSMSASWNNGLELSTKNKDFRVHVGGRTQFDTSFYAVPENVNSDPTLQHRIRDGV
ncbi:MAG: hypothetical protein NT069_18385, partial [Planctomycetota bacterium]|nr:hypothetical protein [Planctomycetota bacterium]